MKKFTKILETQTNEKYFEILAEIKLIVKSDNEGEAGYKSDSILGLIEEQVDFKINNIGEVSKEEYQKYFENISESEEESEPSYLYMGKYAGSFSDNGIEKTDEEKIKSTWGALFGNSNPNTQKRMEFYHRMRLAGIDGKLILKFLKNPIKEI